MNSFKRHQSLLFQRKLEEHGARDGNLVVIGWTHVGTVKFLHVCRTNTDTDKVSLIEQAKEWLQDHPDDCASVYEVVDGWPDGLSLYKEAVWEQLSLNDYDLEECISHNERETDLKRVTVDRLVNLAEQLVSRVRYLEEKVVRLEGK